MSRCIYCSGDIYCKFLLKDMECLIGIMILKYDLFIYFFNVLCNIVK